MTLMDPVSENPRERPPKVFHYTPKPEHCLPWCLPSSPAAGTRPGSEALPPGPPPSNCSLLHQPPHPPPHQVPTGTSEQAAPPGRSQSLPVRLHTSTGFADAELVPRPPSLWASLPRLLPLLPLTPLRAPVCTLPTSRLPMPLHAAASLTS